MNCADVYEALVNRAMLRTADGYVERHHIAPRCLGGSDDPSNIVNLTAREHFVAHQLLVRIYPGNRSLSWAAFLMSRRERFNPGQSRRYDGLKRAAAADISHAQKGASLEMTEGRRRAYMARLGIPLSQDHRDEISRSNTGKRRTPEVLKKYSEAAKKRSPPSIEAREKISRSLSGNSRRKGIPNSPEMKEKLRSANCGRKQSQEEKDKRAAARRRITDEAIRGVRTDAALGGLTHEEIAVRNGTSKTHVGRILRREMYAEVA